MVLSLPWRFFSPSSLLNLIPSLLYSTLFSFSHPLFLTDKRFLTHISQHASITSHGVPFPPPFNLCRNIEHLKQLKSLLVVHDLIESDSIFNEFVMICSSLGAPHLAKSAFESLENPGLFSQNVIIRCLCNHGLYDDLLFIYRKCRNLGCLSDRYTFPFVIKACSGLGYFRVGEGIHSFVLRTGFESNVVVQTALVDFYARSGYMGTARKAFDKIPKPDVVSWNALLSGYSLNGFNEEAFGVFQQIRVMGLRPNVSTLASIIPLCSRVGSFDIGQCLHGYSVKSGFSSDDPLTPAFISMYAGVGDLSSVVHLFDSSCRKNVVAWNSIISAFTQNQKPSEAFENFREMLRSSMQPNMVTFVSIIPSCDNPSCISYGELLHSCVIRNGLEDQISVMTALLSMYAKLGDLTSAKIIFYQMPQKSLLSWNSMISGYVHNGMWDASLAAFREMQSARFEPDAVSIISILSACLKLKAVLLGKSAHALSLKEGFDSNLNVLHTLLGFYFECCHIHSSFNLFHRMPIRNTVSWNVMISGCVDKGETQNAVALLQQMQQQGMKLDLVTLISILPSFDEQKNLVQGMGIHSYAIRTGFDLDISLTNALISMYISCEDLVSGKLLFEIMPERNVISWNTLITGYRYHNLNNETMATFNQMIEDGLKPNYVTLLTILPVCCTSSQGKSIHAHAVRMEISLEVPLLTSLMFMYARFGNIEKCSFLFEMGGKGNISLWNAIMSVHVQSEKANRAITFFSDLHRMGMQPDHVTILTLISACVQLNGENLARFVLAYAIHKGFDTDVVISNSLIDLYARCGNISSARLLFQNLREKNTVSWSVMINGYGLQGDGDEALALLSQMKLLGMRPDAITYLSALSACSHGGLVEQSKMVFSCMLEDGIMPKIEHYTCMVDLLGRTGHLNDAYDVAKSQPFRPSISQLESLLGACRVHGNVDLGEEIGGLLLELDPENPVAYVMLHNTYAEAGRWVDANLARTNMEARNLRKTPGFSLVEGNEHPTYISYAEGIRPNIVIKPHT